MNRMLIGVALVAVSTGALAQDVAETDWAYFEPEGAPLQAGVVAQDGSQLILKCDKPGKRSVYAVVATNSSLAPPMSDDRYESHPVTLRMDENPPWDDNWRFNGRFAMAVDKGNVRSLTRLLEKLHDADKLELRLQPIMRSPVTIEYEVTGARDAIERVYASCKDTIPIS